MSQKRAALVFDPTRKALYTALVAGQAGYPTVSIRRSVSRTIEEIINFGCNYDLVIIIDRPSGNYSPGVALLQCLRDEGFEGLIVFLGDPISRGIARAIGGEGFEWASSPEHLEAVVKVSTLVVH